jgi:hypothetical protein
MSRCQIPVDADCGVSLGDPCLPLRLGRSPKPGDDEGLINCGLDVMGIRIAGLGRHGFIRELLRAQGVGARVGAKAHHNPSGQRS